MELRTTAGTNLTPQGLAKYGIKTLALTESCAHVQPGKKPVSIENTYQDITNLGAIFDVPARANALIGQMKAQIAAVRAKVANLPRVSVFDYDSGTSAPFTAPGLATPTALIELAGGSNIFASLKQSWTSVSWEQVVARKPQCIIINDYGTPTWQQKEKFLTTNAASRNLPAVRDHCIIHLAYDEVTPGPRNAEAVGGWRAYCTRRRSVSRAFDRCNERRWPGDVHAAAKPRECGRRRTHRVAHTGEGQAYVCAGWHTPGLDGREARYGRAYEDRRWDRRRPENRIGKPTLTVRPD